MLGSGRFTLGVLEFIQSGRAGEVGVEPLIRGLHLELDRL
jgi:hypothetical protein